MHDKRSKSLSPARQTGAAQLHFGREASKPAKRARSLSPLYPRPKRIGGGYDWEPLPDLQQLLHSPRRRVEPDGSRVLHGAAAQAAKAARKRMYSSARAHISANSSRHRAWMLKAVPGQKDIYTEYELSIVAEMLFMAEDSRPRSSIHIQVSCQPTACHCNRCQHANGGLGKWSACVCIHAVRLLSSLLQTASPSIAAAGHHDIWHGGMCKCLKASLTPASL